MPLSDDLRRSLCILVTRPQPQADAWVLELVARGVDAVALPLLEIDAPADPSELRRAWRELQGPQQLRAVMFVSPNAVDRFFAAAPAGTAWPPGLLAAGTGPGTAAALRQAGVPDALLLSPAAHSPSFDSEALWPLLLRHGPWRDQRLLVVRGEGGRDWLAEQVRGLGGTVQFVEAYRRLVPRLGTEQRARLAEAIAHPAKHAWLFSSSEALGHLPTIAPQADWSAALAWVTHSRIALAARGLGFGRVELVSPTPQAVALRAGVDQG